MKKLGKMYQVKTIIKVGFLSAWLQANMQIRLVDMPNMLMTPQGVTFEKWCPVRCRENNLQSLFHFHGLLHRIIAIQKSSNFTIICRSGSQNE
jgi:hypothetical protein